MRLNIKSYFVIKLLCRPVNSSLNFIVIIEILTIIQGIIA